MTFHFPFLYISSENKNCVPNVIVRFAGKFKFLGVILRGVVLNVNRGVFYLFLQ
jgi:hypothetical protein